MRAALVNTLHTSRASIARPIDLRHTNIIILYERIENRTETKKCTHFTRNVRSGNENKKKQTVFSPQIILGRTLGMNSAYAVTVVVVVSISIAYRCHRQQFPFAVAA